MKNFEPRMNAYFPLSLRERAGVRDDAKLDLRCNPSPSHASAWAPSSPEGRGKEYSRSFASIGGSLLAVLMLLAATPARAEAPSPQTLLMVANVAGECDVLYSMVEFQKKSHINGGEEYVAKFWADQSAKAGLTVDQLSDRCGKSTAAYDKILDSTAQKEKPANGNE